MQDSSALFYILLGTATVGLLRWRGGNGKKKQHGRVRSMSFNSHTLVAGSFPDNMNVAEPIVNCVLTYKECPDKLAVYDACKNMCSYVRFRSSCTKNSSSGQYEFTVKELHELDLDKIIITTPCSDEAEIDREIEKVVKSQFDGSDGHVMWRLHLFPNTGGGQSATLFRVHHVIGDGIALVSAMQKMFRVGADGDMVTLNIAEKMQGATNGIKSMNYVWLLFDLIKSFFSVVTLAMSSYDTKTIVTDPGHKKAPMDLEKRKMVTLPTLKLDFVKKLKNAAGVTVNDVVLCGVTGALKRYCQARKDPAMSSEFSKKLQMRALIPVAFPRGREEQEDMDIAMSNKWAMVSAAMPVAADDAKARLTESQKEMTGIKNSTRVIVQNWVQSNLLSLLPTFFAKQTASDIFSRHSMVFSNIPGPEKALFLGRYRLCGMKIVFPNLLNQAIIISYGGGLFGTLVVDTSLVTDPDELKQYYLEEIKAQAKGLGVEYNDSVALLEKPKNSIWSAI